MGKFGRIWRHTGRNFEHCKAPNISNSKGGKAVRQHIVRFHSPNIEYTVTRAVAPSSGCGRLSQRYTGCGQGPHPLSHVGCTLHMPVACPPPLLTETKTLVCKVTSFITWCTHSFCSLLYAHSICECHLWGCHTVSHMEHVPYGRFYYTRSGVRVQEPVL